MNKAICRLCLSEDAVVNIFENAENNVLSMINRCCPINILREDGLPQRICIQCLSTLGVCDVFLSKCIESDRVLKEQNNIFLTCGVIKIEPSNNTDFLYEDDIDNQSDVLSAEWLDEEIKKDCKEENVENEEMINVKSDELKIEYDESPSDTSKVKSKTIKRVSKIKSKPIKRVSEVKSKPIKKVSKIKKVFKRDPGYLYEQVECDICHKTVKRRNMKIHALTHSHGPFFCKLCPCQYTTQSRLMKHYNKLHPNHTFKCEFCRRAFIEKNTLISHIQSVHPNGNPFTCETCCKAFTLRRSLLRHKSQCHGIQQQDEINRDEPKMTQQVKVCISKEKNDKPKVTQQVKACISKEKKKKDKPKKVGNDCKVVCDICGKSILRKDISCHKRSHVVNKNYVCTICSKAFRLNDTLKNHMYTHSEERSTCDICKKTFKSKLCLTSHIRLVHRPRKPCKCDICGKEVRCKSSLLLHKRTHTGERPYSCKFCDQRFAMSSSLIEHERLHLGITPYKCPCCPKAFTQLGNMKSHFKNNHRDIVFNEVYKPLGRDHKVFNTKSLQISSESTDIMTVVKS